MAGDGRMRNEDFRKLLATPRPGGASSLASSQTQSTAGHGFTHKQSKTHEQKKSKYRPPIKKSKEKSEADELYTESEARLHEIMTKYRDRAAERRKGEVDGQDIELRAKLTSGLRAFRDEDESLPAADRREQKIKESKYLGGDIDHTHLVKGLDYSLLNRTRSEIKSKDQIVEEEHDIEAAFQNPVSKHAMLNKLAKSKFTRSICKTLFEALPPTRNEFFQRGRMAYIVELEDNQGDDVPVTLLRSTFDCVNDKSEQNMNANNMLINKLTEVLSYLRSDNKKKRKEVVKEVSSTTNKKENIFDDVGEYKLSRESKSSRSERHKGGERERNYFDDEQSRDRDHNYDRQRGGDRDRDVRRSDKDDRSKHSRPKTDRKQATKPEHNPFPQTSAALGTLPEEPKPKKSRLEQDEAYGELFPSSDMYYGGGDSDDEDFSKMDMGNKKGPVRRFDFDTEEDYEKYQSGREANPKAAFQFGVKTNSGRKTRKNNVMAMEKKLDREFEKITKIWQKKDGKPSAY